MSYTLYPPIVDSQMKAFKVGDACRIYFSLSKFNSSADFKTVHVSIVEQISNKSWVDTTQPLGSTGILLNKTATRIENQDNLYYVDIEGNEVAATSGGQTGWNIGTVYKVQLRLSTETFDPNGTIGAESWLSSNSAAGNFSEWSTVTVVKATADVKYKLKIGTATIDNKSVEEGQSADEKVITIFSSTLELSGKFDRSTVTDNTETTRGVQKGDPSEYIKYYQFILYDESGRNILDDSGKVYVQNDANNMDAIYFLSKYELKDETNYLLSFRFETEHGIVGGFYLSEDMEGEEIDHRITLLASSSIQEQKPFYVLTVDHNANYVLEYDSRGKPKTRLGDLTSLEAEEDEGRIALRIVGGDENLYSGNLCIRRSDSRTNFTEWCDIKIIVCKQKRILDIDFIYDYTIEHGVWYKYGIQEIDRDGNRSQLEVMDIPIMRDFNYSFLIGKGGKQLKLMFDNTMPNYKIQVAEGKVDPLSSVYPIVTRNAATRYKAFPVNGLITFWMDENNTFTSRTEIYGDSGDPPPVDLYNNYNKENNIVQYDYIYEKEFRKKVLDFLYDGELKLFKSPTEGNVIIRLMDINCVPNQSLGRMIYSFTSMAYEMDDNTMENYEKYGFYEVGEYATDFAVYVTKIGQIQMNVPLSSEYSVNILQEIYNKYNIQTEDIGGYTRTIGDVYCLKLTFDSKPMSIIADSNIKVNNNTSDLTRKELLTLGYKFKYNGQTIAVTYPHNIYEFDERIRFNPSLDSITIESDEQGKQESVSITVDFLYELAIEEYKGRRVAQQTTKKIIGEFFKECTGDYDIFSDIYYDYLLEIENDFRDLRKLSSIEIEANPGSVFLIRDNADQLSELDYFMIGDTGKLRLYELSNITNLAYAGLQWKSSDVIKGYFNDTDSKFYQDARFTIPIEIEAKKGYQDIPSTDYYIYNSQSKTFRPNRYNPYYSQDVMVKYIGVVVTGTYRV